MFIFVGNRQLMEHTIKVKVTDFRAVDSAEIVLDGITVVSGENGCGKSTLSKLLYYAFKTVNEYELMVRQNLYISVDAILKRTSNLVRDLHPILKKYNADWDGFDLFPPKKDYFSLPLPALASFCIGYVYPLSGFSKLETAVYSSSDKEFISSFLVRAKMVLISVLKENGNTSDLSGASFEMIIAALVEILSKLFAQAEAKLQDRNIDILDAVFSRYFSGQIVEDNFNLYEYGVCITDRRQNRVLNLSSVERVLYIDTPMAVGIDNGFTHWWELNEILRNSGYPHLKNEELGTLLSQEILHGNVGIDKNLTERFEYLRSDGLKVNLLDCATGIKAFAVLQLLIKNGFLNNKTLLIIDEPEAHLHPQWIVEYARLVVLLNKELGVKFFIATHNPDMISALKYISEKEAVTRELNFYLAERNSDFSYVYKSLGTDIDEIFGSFNIALDRINQYGVVEDEIL